MVATQRTIVPGLTVSGIRLRRPRRSRRQRHLQAGRLGPGQRRRAIPARPAAPGRPRPDHRHVGQQRGDPMTRVMRQPVVGPARSRAARSWSSSPCRSSSSSAWPASRSTADRRSRSVATSRPPQTSPPWPAPTTTSSTTTSLPRSPEPRPIATSNGFTAGVDGTSVTVGVDTSNGVAVTVAIDKPHRNSFLAIVGHGELAGHHDRHVARRLPGQRLGRLAVHLPDQRVRQRRDAQVPDRDGLRRSERRHPGHATSTSPGPTSGPAT